MSLATRCTACGTVFRVVQDQLKVSEGWVRCGRCNEVFNAIEGLFDLQRDTPPDWVPPPPAPVATAPHAEDDAALPDEGDSTAALGDPPSQADKIDAQLLGPRHGESGSTPATRIDERDRLEFPDAQFDPEFLEDDDVAPPAAADAESSASEWATAGDASAEPSDPGFLRHADRKARWQRPVVRGALAVAALLLLGALALQWMHQSRDLVAARWPGVRPALLAWCDGVGCTIEAPRRIDEVSVESTALARAGADAFKLSVTLRNRGAMAVALPSVDLSLTDPGGQLVARKVLGPRDFRVASALMAPGADAALQLTLTAGNARVTGYSVEIFYP